MDAEARAVVETWVSIGDRYSVSSLGRVRSHRLRPGILKTQLDHNGYARLDLWLDGKSRGRLVHRLVLGAFVGAPPSARHQAAHLDGVKTNNRLDNLVWATPEENAAHKNLHGTQPIGERNGQARITSDTVILVRRLRARGWGLRQIALALGIGETMTERIASFRNWRHVVDPAAICGVASGRPAPRGPVKARASHCLRGHEYTEANMITGAKGRWCRACKAVSDRRHRSAFNALRRTQRSEDRTALAVLRQGAQG